MGILKYLSAQDFFFFKICFFKKKYAKQIQHKGVWICIVSVSQATSLENDYVYTTLPFFKMVVKYSVQLSHIAVLFYQALYTLGFFS